MFISGCLPTLATIPVWIGLYRALSNVADEVASHTQLWLIVFLWLPLVLLTFMFIYIYTHTHFGYLLLIHFFASNFKGLLTEGFFWIPSLSGPTTVAARQNGSGISWLFPFVVSSPFWDDLKIEMLVSIHEAMFCGRYGFLFACNCIGFDGYNKNFRCF